MEQKKMAELNQLIESRYRNIAGMNIMKNGKLVYEKYFNGCTSQSTLHVYSVTKSIVSILIGIAMDQGYIKDVHQRVLDFFPEYAAKRQDSQIENVTLEDILTMRAAYKYRIPPYIKYFTSDDWLTFSLDQLKGRGRDGAFRYTPLIGPDILTGILRKATQQSVLGFAQENLFTPLNIKVNGSFVFQSKEEQMAFNQATDRSGWAADAQGLHAAGWGLSLSARDMARLGQLYLNGGMWGNKQLVSRHWVQDSTTEHNRWKRQNLPYGYLWWIDEKEHSFAAMGDGGNIIYVNPKEQLVVSLVCIFERNVRDSMELIRQFIEPLYSDIQKKQ